MSEKIYTRLLRLYPSSFRKKYEAEALQLIRDRLRDERGFFKRARLWWDLVANVLAGSRPPTGIPTPLQNQHPFRSTPRVFLPSKSWTRSPWGAVRFWSAARYR